MILPPRAFLRVAKQIGSGDMVIVADFAAPGPAESNCDGKRLLKFRLPIFQIPDFPRGALLVTTLFAIALLGAFPDAPYSWILGIVIAAGVIAWVLGSG